MKLIGFGELNNSVFMLLAKSKSRQKYAELIKIDFLFQIRFGVLVPGKPPRNLSYIDLGSNRTVVQAAAGGLHTCALLDNHAIKCRLVSPLFQSRAIPQNEWFVKTEMDLGGHPHV